MIAYSRKYVEANYIVVNNVIQNDEFRGEPVFAPHFFYKSVGAQFEKVSHTRVLSSMNEEQTTQYVALVVIDAAERSEFAEIAQASHVLVTQDPDIEQVIVRLVFADEVGLVIKQVLATV